MTEKEKMNLKKNTQAKIAMLLLLALAPLADLGHQALAAPDKKAPLAKPGCSVMTWPFGDKLADTELSKIFHKTRRSKLIAYWFGELSSAKHPELVHTLGSFLETTEPNELMQGYFQVVMHGADPEDGSSQIKPLDPNELCDNYIKTKKAIQ